MAEQQNAVIILAYGGPEYIEDVPDYLRGIRAGRPTPQELIDEITERYRHIGGGSPLREITENTADKLEKRLGMPVYVGMRHWSPYIKDTVAQMASDGVRTAAAICMAPHYSDLSIGAYRTQLEEAIAATGSKIDISFIESWFGELAYVEGIVAAVRTALSKKFTVGDRVHIVFTAHSLPASILERGDPYDAQLRETAMYIAMMLRLTEDRWRFCYQSPPQGVADWLGPQLRDVIMEIGMSGHKHMLVVPIGFIAEHVEILYDIDVEAKEVAARCGVHLERTAMLNDSDAVIEALASAIGARFTAATPAT